MAPRRAEGGIKNSSFQMRRKLCDKWDVSPQTTAGFKPLSAQARLWGEQTGLFTQKVALTGYKDAPGGSSNTHLGRSEAEQKETSDAAGDE